jgi:Putative Flp pilus-assembly TadE/G-like
VVILVVVAMSIFLFGALGLAIDGGQMYAQRQMAQAAADAAAQAGIMSILDGTNITSAFPFGTGSTPIASYVCTATDGRTPCVYARYNGFGGTTADTVTLSFPSTVSGVTLSSATVPALAVTVQRTLKTGLIRFVGAGATSTITAKATAALVGTVSPDSIIVLNPSAQNAFQASNGANVTVTGGGIAIDSNNSDAATIQGATVTASAIDIVGGATVNNGGTTSPAPVTGTAVLADPFASLPALTPGSCATHPTMYSPGSGATLSPGTYCGGITVSNGATNVVFSAGDYIINGGGMTFGGGATATGSGVMFYLTGTNATYASVTIANGVSVTFSAPASGPYQGILFFQNRSITSSSNATFAGGASMSLSGSLYFPTTDVSFSNGTSAETYSTAIVANEISFTGGANIKYDPTGLKTGLFTNSVALVQ